MPDSSKQLIFISGDGEKVINRRYIWTIESTQLDMWKSKGEELRVSLRFLTGGGEGDGGHMPVGNLGEE